MRCVAVSRTKRLYPFRIDAWVVLPEHMQAMWTLPEGDAAYSTRWALIKRWFSAAIPPGEDRSASRAANGGSQRRARALAAPLLGTHGARRGGFLPARRLCPFQPGQARISGERSRTALLIVPAGGRARALSIQFDLSPENSSNFR